MSTFSRNAQEEVVLTIDLKDTHSSDHLLQGGGGERGSRAGEGVGERTPGVGVAGEESVGSDWEEGMKEGTFGKNEGKKGRRKEGAYGNKGHTGQKNKAKGNVCFRQYDLKN